MPYNILILPLLGGFIFVTRWDRSSWHAGRAEKDRLLILASLAGFCFLTLAFAIRSIPPFIPCIDELPCLPSWWNQNIGFPYSGISAFAFLLGAVGWWPLNRISDWWHSEWARDDHRGSRRREFARVVSGNGGPLEQLLLRSMEDELSVMITLRGGKVYIGDVGTIFVPGQHNAIHLLPSRSGFRDDLQRLVITTDYDAAAANLVQTKGSEAARLISCFVTVIPVNEVIAASLYIPEIHANYFHPKTNLISPS